jgi:hypothetical protein
MNVLTLNVKTSVKVIGANGQISLGKDYAGRQVLVEEHEPGVWLVRTAIVIPENERWLHEPQAAASLQSALAWASKHKSKTTNIDTLFDGMNHVEPKGRTTRSARSKQSGVSKKPTRA